MLISFLKSPGSIKLHDETERYLSEGKKVALRLTFTGGNPKYELKVE